MTISMYLTVGGAELQATHVNLYPAPMVMEWRALAARAQALMGGVSSPIGFLGSPEWAIGGALVTGFLASAASSGMAKEGVKVLQDAANLLAEIRNAGRPFAVETIRGVDLPYPASWAATGPGYKTVEMSSIGMMHRAGFLAENRRTKADVIDGKVKIDAEVDFINVEAEFVLLYTGRSSSHVRWTAVDRYRVGPAEATE